MKWCFLVNNVDLLMEFSGKLAAQALNEGDEVVLVFNSKMAEYIKRKYFPKSVKVISKVDWLVKNYKKDQKAFKNIFWKDFFPTFERKHNLLNLNYENSKDIVSQLYQFFDFLFKDENPDIVVNEAPANIFTNIAYHFCEKYNKNYLGFIGSRFDDKIDIYDKKHTCSLYKKTFEDLTDDNILKTEKQFAENFIKDFISHKKLLSYMDFQASLSSSTGFLRYLKREVKMMPYWSKYVLNHLHFGKFDYESETGFKYKLFYPVRSIIRKFRSAFFNKKFDYLSDDDEFFLYPLHFHPEASTLVQATYFSDQLNTIKNIAFSLPFPYKLYVKEHPASVGTRPANFYKEIRKLPNAVLISPEENVENLVKKSTGVVTLTSTIGIEAALAGKRVYVLGDVFYTYHPLCVKVTGFEDLRQKIDDDAAINKSIENLKEKNIRFVLSYFKNTVSGSILDASKKEDTNNYPQIYRYIKNMFFKINEQN